MQILSNDGYNWATYANQDFLTTFAQFRRMQMALVFDEVRQVYQKAELSLEKIKALNLLPDGMRDVSRVRLPISKASEIIGKTRQSILNALKKGIIPNRSNTNRGEGFTLEIIHFLQKHFGTQPYRESVDEPIIIAMQNFKGGVAKSTQACSLAHYLAERGYRTLLIDQDSQGSTTATFGLLPDKDITQEETLFPFYYGSFEDGRPCESIDYAIRKTHWDGLDLIPSNLLFYHAEYVLASYLKGKNEPLTILRDGLQGTAEKYDVVIIDAPPALGFISLNVLSAANAYIIPTPPGLYDYMSTFQFLTMLFDLFDRGIIAKDRNCHFIKILPTRVDNNEVDATVLKILRSCYGEHLMKGVIPNSKYIKEASNLMTTIYEMPNVQLLNKEDSDKKVRPISSMTGYKTARKAMDAVNREIEEMILSTRQSRVNRLIKEAS
jgi:chromosome partitioning protein